MLSTCNYHPFWNDDNPRPLKHIKVNNKSTKPTKTTEIFDSSLSPDLHCSETLTFTGSIINKKISVYRQRYTPPETIYNRINLPTPSITYEPQTRILSNLKKTDQDNTTTSSIINELTKNQNTILHYIINNNDK
tara:strand:+ start:4776 stop:5177 length:402 start_codon:yes stop_codon:yes gene_type:complete